jgi:hypothetical protein
MPTTPDNQLSRRERIMREIARRARGLTEGQPPSDPYLTTFGLVTRGSSLEGVHETVGPYALAIVDTDEQANIQIQHYIRRLTVVLEFSAYVDSGEEPSEVANRVLADLQRKFREDLNLTEPDDGVRALLDRKLAVNVEEVRTQLFIDGYDARKVSGALFLLVTYKTGAQDPRVYVC